MSNSRNLRNLLIIAYLFPPINGIGVQRPLKFTKYLQEFGWNPTVLTVKNGYHVAYEEALLQEVPETVKIYRANDPVSIVHHRIRRKNTLVRVDPKTSSTGTVSKATAVGKENSNGIVKYLKAIKDVAFIPDEHILWVLSAIRIGMKAIKQNKIQAIYSTSGPNSSHLVGYWLKKQTGLPWIADFRDPWTENMHQHTSIFRSRVENFMERLVVKDADTVVTVTNSFAEGFQKKNVDVIRRIEVIPNGFDANEFDSVQPIPNEDRFTLVYTGILYEKRSPKMFLQGLKIALDRGDIPRNDIIVHFAGVFDYPGRNENTVLVEQLGLLDVVSIDGYLSHQESISLMKGADVLLLIGDVNEKAGQYIPGKLFEYLGSKRPILSLTVPGEVSSIVEKYKFGQVVDPMNPVAIADRLVAYYQSWVQNRCLPSPKWDKSLTMYDRKVQTHKLASILDELVMKE